MLSKTVLGYGKSHLLFVPGNTCSWKIRLGISSRFKTYLGAPKLLRQTLCPVWTRSSPGVTFEITQPGPDTLGTRIPRPPWLALHRGRLTNLVSPYQRVFSGGIKSMGSRSGKVFRHDFSYYSTKWESSSAADTRMASQRCPRPNPRRAPHLAKGT